MFSVFWGFVGFLTGLLITSVFTPPARGVPSLPSPSDHTAHDVGTGCVKFQAEEVPCDGTQTSLNVIASKHK